MLWQPEQVIHGRYQLLSLKRDRPGHQVWLATDQQTHEQVILKTLAFTGAIQWDEVKLFEREIEILQILDHPQIPTFVDAFTQDQPYYCKCLVEQYIHAPSLQAFLDRHQKIPDHQIWSIGLQVLKILRDLHQGQRCIIHRDLKPSNILIDSDKSVYLIDLGAAGGQKNKDSSDPPTTVGSYGYTPMEQFMGQAVPASDLYALGATLMHSLTQTPPTDLLNSQLRLALPQQQSISAPLRQWLYQLTAPQVSDRFATAELAQSSLAQAQTHHQMLGQTSSESRLSMSSDLAAVHIKPIWNEETIAAKDKLALVGLSFLPLMLGGQSAIAAINHASGLNLLGTELLIALISLLPTGLFFPRLFWKLVSQSVAYVNSELQAKWSILGIRVRHQRLPQGDIATLRISQDTSDSWQMSQVRPSDQPIPLIRRLPGHDLEAFYQAVEHWLV